MGPKKIVDLRSLDWDDRALLKAYHNGMRLKAAEASKGKEGEDSSCKENTVTKWKAGDYCRAVYPEDNLKYEAQIVSVSGEKCTVYFLGYEDELEVNMNHLVPSRGKRSRKKQIKKAKRYLSAVVSSVDESASEVPTADDSEIQSPQTPRTSKKKNSQTFDPDASYEYPAMAPHHVNCRPPVFPNTVSTVPQIPPMPMGSDIAGNSALSAAMTAWYMAGYYTGFSEGQKQSQCMQRCGHHPISIQPPSPPLPVNPDGAKNVASPPVLISWYLAGYYTGFYEGQKTSSSSSCMQHCGHNHVSSGPQFPPVPTPSHVARNSSSSSMTAWYMAGYYTGLHEANKPSQDIQHAGHVTQACCRH